MPASQKSTDTSRAGTHKTADVAWRSFENAQQATQSTLNTAGEEVHRTVAQFTDLLGLSKAPTEELARQSSRTIDALTQCGAVLAQGAQDISREWVRLAGDRLQHNLEGLKELAHCRTLPDLISLQSRLARENFEHMLSNSRRIAEISLQVVSEASEITAQAEKNERRAA